MWFDRQQQAGHKHTIEQGGSECGEIARLSLGGNSSNQTFVKSIRKEIRKNGYGFNRGTGS